MTLKEDIKWLDFFIKKQIREGEDVTFLRSIISRLKQQENKEQPSPYHNEAMGCYFEWLELQGLPIIRSPSQGKAMKSILKQLREASNNKTDEAALESFKVILKLWPRLNYSLAINKQLSGINKNLLEIIDKIKNGATKNATRSMEANSFYERIKNKTYGSTDTDG